MKANQINTYINERLMDVRTLANSAASIKEFESLTNSYLQFGINCPEYLEAEQAVRAGYAPLVENNYYDLFFITPTGEIVFTLLHEADFATNLFTGPYRDSTLAHVVQESLKSLSSTISPR